MAHCNTIFHQMLKIIPRHEFGLLDKQHGTGRKSRTFSRWNQFVHLIFIQLTARASLRDGVAALSARFRNLYHLGARPVARTTFADANTNRPAAFFDALFSIMYRRCQPVAPKHNFKFKNKLYSLDASVVSLCLSLFPWACFRKTKAVIKFHALLDHDGYLPAFVSISEAKRHEINEARCLILPKGSIVVMDKAFTDYAWFSTLSKGGIFFVTRQKKNTSYRVIERRKANKKLGVTSDQIIWLTGLKGADYPRPLRRVGYRDPQTKKHYVFLTNNFKFSAKTIANIYKERWQIEIFFRWIKQNLKIKVFLGNSENAVMTQIYVALIAYLLLCYIKFLCNIDMSLQRLLQLLQLNLFRRCTMQELIQPPEKQNQFQYNINQLNLCFA